MPHRSRRVGPRSMEDASAEVRPAGHPGDVDHHRYLQRAAVVHEALQEEAVVAHHVAVVRGEHDDRVLPDAEFVEPLEHLADRVVDHPDHPVGRGDRLAQQGVLAEAAGRHPVTLVPGMNPRELLEMGGRSVEGIVARRRQGHVRRTVAVEPLAGRCHRMVRIGKRAPGEPRLPAASAASMNATVRSATNAVEWSSSGYGGR